MIDAYYDFLLEGKTSIKTAWRGVCGGHQLDSNVFITT